MVNNRTKSELCEAKHYASRGDLCGTYLQIKIFFYFFFYYIWMQHLYFFGLISALLASFFQQMVFWIKKIQVFFA